MKTAIGDPHEFVEAFERRYLSLTEIPRACDVELFDREDASHRDRSFLQVGVRTSFPVEVVESWEPGFVARQVVDGIQVTELSVIADAAREADAERVRAADVEDLLVSLEERGVEHLLMPRKGGTLERFREADVVDRRRSDDAAVASTPEGVEMELHLHSGEGAYGLKEGSVEVVQKRGDDARPPEFDFFDDANFNFDRRLMVYFGDEVRTVDGRRYFDLIYRVVFSRPEIAGEIFELEV